MSASISTISGYETGPSTSGRTGVAQERVVLSKLVRTYQSSLNDGKDEIALQPLAKQIATASQQLGQTVTLPPPTVTPASAIGESPASGEAVKVDLRL